MKLNLKREFTAALAGAAVFVTVGAAGQEQREKDALATDATEAEAPPFFRLGYSGDLGERPALTGDWGGLRNQLAADEGISFELELEQLIQGNAHGGKDTNNAFRYSGSWDLRLKFDTGRMGLWPGGLLEVHGESFFGQSINRKSGGTPNDDALYPVPGDRDVMLSHVVFTQFLSESFGIFFGKLDTTTEDKNEFAWVHGNTSCTARCDGTWSLRVPHLTLRSGPASSSWAIGASGLSPRTTRRVRQTSADSTRPSTGERRWPPRCGST